MYNSRDLRNNKFALLNRLQRQVDETNNNSNNSAEQISDRNGNAFGTLKNAQNITPPAFVQNTKIGLFKRRDNKGR